MKTETQTRQEQETAQRKSKNQGSVSQILQTYKLKSNQSTSLVAQRWPFSKPAWVKGPGEGVIPFMRAQYNPEFRTSAHKDLLDNTPETECLAQTVYNENDYASQYPWDGSMSMVGDAGIGFHKGIKSIRNWFG